MLLQPASDSSLLITLGHEISLEVNARVIRLFHQLNQAPPPWLENLHPAYATLLIDFNPRLTTHHDVTRFVHNLPTPPAEYQNSKTVELEVEYFGEDLAEVARIHSLAPENLIQLHSSSTYHVAFLGFVPGFAYLLGLPPELATPRLATPRLKVPAGSVAIGGAQTGVYPTDSPGGWRIIGHIRRTTPLPPDWISPGDQVRFIPV